MSAIQCRRTKREADDERNLWPDVARLARELGHPTLFCENVPGILRYYWDVIKPELQAMGYSVAEGLYTAAETGAPHRRQRLFFMAHRDSGLSDHEGQALCAGRDASDPRSGELAGHRGLRTARAA